MTRVVELTPADFERVSPVLASLSKSNLESGVWRRLFAAAKTTELRVENYGIEIDGKIKGFMSHVISERDVEGKRYKFLNQSTWVVEKEARGKSLELFRLCERLSDHIVTNLTPSENVIKLITRLGFQAFETEAVLIPPLPGFRSRIVRQDADEAVRTHAAFGAPIHKLADAGGAVVVYGHLIKRRRLKFFVCDRLSVGADVNLNHLAFKLLIAFGAVGLIVDRRFLTANCAYRAIKTLPRRRFLRGNLTPPTLSDNLFTELSLLGL